MGEGIPAKVANILASEGESKLNGLMADLIRVLAVYKGVSWRSELFVDLSKMYEFLGRVETVNPRLLDEALERLSSEGLIRVEERVRGLMLSPGTYRDKLIHLVDLPDVMRVLVRDRCFREYMRDRYERVRRRIGLGGRP